MPEPTPPIQPYGAQATTSQRAEAAPAAGSPAKLSWSLVIATFQRHEILKRCLYWAMVQTRPPAEVIVIDASDRWEAHRDEIARLYRDQNPDVGWTYEPARVRSSAGQRNQGIALARGDVLFLIDDDSLMFPDCAERIMRAYEADTGGRVLAMSAEAASRPPAEADLAALRGDGELAKSAQPVVPSSRADWGSFKQRLRRWLKAKEIVIPYDAAFPRHGLPEPLASDPNVNEIRSIGGFLLTERAQAARAEPFDPMLEVYAAGEDTDQSLRLARRGPIAVVLGAYIFHASAPGGRLSPFVVNALAAMNLAALHRVNADDPRQARARLAASYRHRARIELAKDIEKRDWRLRRWRGWRHGASMADTIFAKNPEELRAWYPGRQRDLVARFNR